jgi:lysophospholipase L1-like esterase
MGTDKQLQCLTYVALGDSLTVGVGASFLAPGFVARYVRLTEKELNKYVFADIYAKSGIETGGVLSIVESPALHEKIKRANMITISARGNDLIHASKKFAKTGNPTELTQSVKEWLQQYGTNHKHHTWTKKGMWRTLYDLLYLGYPRNLC